MFIAVRCNERAASSIGVDVARTKLLAFGLSAFIAGIGGGLLAYQQGNINPASFTLWTSLTILAITYVGGVGRIAGALAAGALLASNGVVPTLLDKLFSFEQYQGVIAGVALALTAVANPDGIAKEMTHGLHQLSGAVMRRVRPAPEEPAPADTARPPAVIAAEPPEAVKR
jgi:branched-chain amino acid transport system permease protein